MVFRMSTIAQLNERIDQLETQLLLKDIETIKQAEKKLNSDLGNFLVLKIFWLKTDPWTPD